MKEEIIFEDMFEDNPKNVVHMEFKIGATASGVVEEKVLSVDYIYDLYKALIDPPNCLRANSIKKISHIVDKGWNTLEDLELAVKEYAKTITNTNKMYRIRPQNFFSYHASNNRAYMWQEFLSVADESQMDGIALRIENTGIDGEEMYIYLTSGAHKFELTPEIEAIRKDFIKLQSN